MIEHALRIDGPVVDFFIIDRNFPSGNQSGGLSRLRQELEKCFPKCYIQEPAGEDLRKEIVRRIGDETVREIISLSRHEVTVSGYYMRYYHFRFVPADGHWVV